MVTYYDDISCNQGVSTTLRLPFAISASQGQWGCSGVACCPSHLLRACSIFYEMLQHPWQERWDWPGGEAVPLGGRRGRPGRHTVGLDSATQQMNALSMLGCLLVLSQLPTSPLAFFFYFKLFKLRFWTVWGDWCWRFHLFNCWSPSSF